MVAGVIELATPAFVLHARPFGESDRIVTFITESQGKLTGIAKGAKNSRRRFAGTLEPFVHVRVVFRQKPTTDLAFLLRCELLEALRGFTRDLDRFGAGSYVLELTDRMVLGRETGGSVYRLVRATLGLLDDGALAMDPLLRAFELHLLAASGYGPALDRCRGCDTSTLTAETSYLAVGRGGFVCRVCVRPGEPVRPVGVAVVRALAALTDEPLERAGQGTTAPALALTSAVIEPLLARVITGPLRSRDFMTRTRVDSAGLVR